ncbi:GNAT family N-acetyltransferase [Streptomyces sp. JJ38]|uniref:GNAT family N-acetyltransferase n=1 Tax=Streptomyces sp. JJ38 TaxID=2738128 RepID=UPI001C564C10|nr:GNAT family N-acetyltransferase [Streptomyces sp. JJ38]MBW1597672.1 GNAT family N-acetyltransferase [Streptomyces sp. JJ38]
MHTARIRYDDPDARRLEAEVQQEYVLRYGDEEGDATPLDPEMFEPPRGLYLMVYDDAGVPVATGAWRAMDRDGEGYQDGDAEIKRMYVVPAARGQGLARKILAQLEADARAAGRARMVLETGDKQPEAIALYESEGYEPCSKFGYYRNEPESRCYAKTLTA